MIRLIAVFKLFKGMLLLAAGFGALRLLHRDVAEVVDGWLDAFRVDPENRHIHGLLVHLANVDEKRLREFSIGTFFYSAVLLCEGTRSMARQAVGRILHHPGDCFIHSARNL